MFGLVLSCGDTLHAWLLPHLGSSFVRCRKSLLRIKGQISRLLETTPARAIRSTQAFLVFFSPGFLIKCKDVLNVSARYMARCGQFGDGLEKGNCE